MNTAAAMHNGQQRCAVKKLSLHHHHHLGNMSMKLATILFRRSYITKQHGFCSKGHMELYNTPAICHVTSMHWLSSLCKRTNYTGHNLMKLLLFCISICLSVAYSPSFELSFHLHSFFFFGSFEGEILLSGGCQKGVFYRIYNSNHL